MYWIPKIKEVELVLLNDAARGHWFSYHRAIGCQRRCKVHRFLHILGIIIKYISFVIWGNLKGILWSFYNNTLLVSVCIYIYMCVYVYISVCIYICVYIYICMVCTLPTPASFRPVGYEGHATLLSLDPMPLRVRSWLDKGNSAYVYKRTAIKTHYLSAALLCWLQVCLYVRVGG